jgi:hypothetical protein
VTEGVETPETPETSEPSETSETSDFRDVGDGDVCGCVVVFVGNRTGDAGFEVLRDGRHLQRAWRGSRDVRGHRVVFAFRAVPPSPAFSTWRIQTVELASVISGLNSARYQ